MKRSLKQQKPLSAWALYLVRLQLHNLYFCHLISFVIWFVKAVGLAF